MVETLFAQTNQAPYAVPFAMPVDSIVADIVCSGAGGRIILQKQAGSKWAANKG